MQTQLMKLSKLLARDLYFYFILKMGLRIKMLSRIKLQRIYTTRKNLDNASIFLLTRLSLPEFKEIFCAYCKSHENVAKERAFNYGKNILDQKSECPQGYENGQRLPKEKYILLLYRFS